MDFTTTLPKNEVLCILRFVTPRFIPKTRFIPTFFGHENVTNQVHGGLKKSAILDFWGIFFHRFGIAVNAEPWQLKNRPMANYGATGALELKSNRLSEKQLSIYLHIFTYKIFHAHIKYMFRIKTFLAFELLSEQ